MITRADRVAGIAAFSFAVGLASLLCSAQPATGAPAEPASVPATPRTVRDWINPKHLPPAPPEEARDLNVLPDLLYTDESFPPRDRRIDPMFMVRGWVLRLAKSHVDRYEQQHAKVTTPDEVDSYRKAAREKFLRQIGGLPERTPLSPVITRTLDRGDHRIEFLYFESLPGVYNTAMLYLPATSGPYPGVVVACGHSAVGKAYPHYQRACMLLARNGIAALIYDPFEQGERWMRGGIGHTVLHMTSIPLGRAAARTWVWDGVRAIDYLQSRPDIIKDRIGATGNSGGGIGAAYVAAVDKRVMAAAPSCFSTSFKRLVLLGYEFDGEQTVPGGIAAGLHHPELFIMRSPRPTALCAAIRDGDWPIDGARANVQIAQRFYDLQDAGDRMVMIEGDHSHGFHPPVRQGMVKFMRKWLLGDDQLIAPEPPDEENPCLSPEEAKVLPRGTVFNLPGAHSVYDHNIAYDQELAAQRAALWQPARIGEALERVRQLTGIRKLDDIPPIEVIEAAPVKRWQLTVERLILKPEPDLFLPANVYVPASPSGQAYLYLHQDGKWSDAYDGGPIQELVSRGHLVMAVDLRGMGETMPSRSAATGFTEYFGHGLINMIWLSEFNVCYLGARAEDVLVCARYLATRRGVKQVHLVSIGRTGPPALHAATLEPGLFASVTLKNSLVSWSSLIQLHVQARHQFANVVYGSQRVYDLPDLAATLPAEKLKVVDPLDAAEQPFEPADDSGL